MVGIIYCNDLNTCPYIEKYLKSLVKHHLQFKVLLWNRKGISMNYPDNYIVYERKSDLYISKWRKIPAFIGYGYFLHKELHRNKFEKIVILTSLPAVLCYIKLIWKYKKRYIYDFRDLSFEKYAVYRNIIKKLIKQSYFTCISSPAYEAVLKEETVIAHNFRYTDLKNRITSIKPLRKKIVLLHIGVTRGEKYNKRLAEVFGNDNRFDIYIIGTGNDTTSFMEYIKEFKNIYVQGTYSNDEKEKYIIKSDGLLYYYPCSFNNNLALANKYYDGIIYKKPLIGNIKTYSGKMIEKRGLGISVDLNEKNIQNKVYDYFQKLDLNKYYNCTEIELKRILDEDYIYTKKIDEFFRL